MNKIARIFLVLAGLGFIIAGLGLGFGPNSTSTYSGRETLNSRADYDQFEEAIFSPEAELQYLKLLESDFSRVVEFSVSIPKSQYFEYGSVDYLSTWVVPVFLSIAGIGIIFLGLLMGGV